MNSAKIIVPFVLVISVIVNSSCVPRMFNHSDGESPLPWLENSESPADSSGGADTVAVKKNGNTLVYVDTHDNYAHTQVVPKGKQPYFKRVNGTSSIGLTFDCAWVNESAGLKIIEFLKQQNIKTTFFISGPFVFKNHLKGMAGGLNTANFKMIKRLVEDGHEFGNHTQTHPHNNNSIPWEKELVELKKGWDAAVSQVFGAAVPANAKMISYWRAPYGEYNDRSLTLASKAGFPHHFGWNVDVLDASGLPSCIVDSKNPKCLSAAKMSQRIVDFAQKNAWGFDGMVVLAHLSNPYDWTGNANGLQKLVTTFKEKGVQFRKLSEFFQPL
jgi:peptidoglycan/xylan/chitin deacetylase (PgdA/CDA1 family)